MTSKPLAPGLYDEPVTHALDARLAVLAPERVDTDDLDAHRAAQVLARVVYERLATALGSLPAERRLDHQVALVNRVLDLVREAAPEAGVEASDHVDRTIGLIHDQGCKAGLVLNPATPVAWLDHVLDKLDLVLVMSVNPGFGGQSFIPGTLDKLRAVRERIARSGREIRLEVDGGVKADNIGAIAAAGADTFVAGSAIFGAKDYRATIAAMRAAVAAA